MIQVIWFIRMLQRMISQTRKTFTNTQKYFQIQVPYGVFKTVWFNRLEMCHLHVQQACHDPVKSFCRLFSIWSFHSILQTHLNSGKNSEGLQHTGVLIVVRHYWREPGSLSHLFQPESRLSTFQVVIQHSHCKWPSGVKLVLKWTHCTTMST